MKYKFLGNTGLKVSEICLGTMTFGEDWGWGASEEESKKQFDYFVDKGGNFIDTANKYTDGSSEKILGNLIKNKRDNFVVATKYTLNTEINQVNKWGNSRKNMMVSLEASLKRLDTDYIDLYWVHFWDFTTKYEEVMRGLDDLVRSGKVLYIGISDAPSWVVSSCNTLAEIRAWSAFQAIQVEYSLIQRTTEVDLLPMSLYNNLSLLAWAPLGGGVLTGKYINKRNDSKRTEINQLRLNDKNQLIVDELISISKQIGKKPSQIAINWLRQKSNNIIPIIGARTNEQISDSLGALEFTLNKEIIERLDKVSAVQSNFPYTMWTPRIKELVLSGNTFDKIEGWKKPF